MRCPVGLLLHSVSSRVYESQLPYLKMLSRKIVLGLQASDKEDGLPNSNKQSKSQEHSEKGCNSKGN